ncbi:hypothetical protein ACQEV4_42585 [Streptomyces shenzhenensis]|uniref:hypothetical protein n=1 Tax=Streptomyces shenzhenensis TaxID=943815 RepID=UPI003D8CB9C1
MTPIPLHDVFGAYDHAPVNPDVPDHLRVSRPEPLLPQCFTCGTRQGPLRPCPLGRRYPSGAQVLHCAAHVPDGLPAAAAAAVLDATMKTNEAATGSELAAAEQQAGILFDAAHVQAAVDAAAEQARTEAQAELAALREQLAGMAGARRQRDAVLRLCEGHRGDDLLLVAAVAAAAEYGTTALDGVPMLLDWQGEISLPEGGAREARAVLECVSSYGGRALLCLTGPKRQTLASLLDLEVRGIRAQCPTPGCGEPAWDREKEAAPPGMTGWACMRVAGVTGAEGEPHWYCSPVCVSNALARAGAEIAAADDMAAGLDARYGPGASDEHALQVAEATEAGIEDERGGSGEDGAW